MRKAILLSVIFTIPLIGCKKEGGLIPKFHDDTLRAGVASVKITPLGFETFNDANSDGYYNESDGDTFNDCGKDRLCLGDEEYSGPDPDGTEGNGIFDAVWIPGFGAGRPANGIHDDLYARALILSYNREYVVFVALDLIGFFSWRIDQARKVLEEEDSIDPKRVIVGSSHVHEGIDTMGIWGPNDWETGVNPAYQEFIIESIVSVVEEAAKNLVPVRMRAGSRRIQDMDPYYNGVYFGGKSPDLHQVGIINDGRDPIVVDDTVSVMQFVATSGETIAVLENWSGHPETLGSRNNYITSDYVHYSRERLEKEFGGTALHFAADVGGMMSSLGATVPLVDEDNKHVYKRDDNGQIIRDSDGDPIPEYAQKDTFEFARSVGNIVAETAITALMDSEVNDVEGISLRHKYIYLPQDNPNFDVALRIPLLDVPLDIFTEGENCGITGCIRERIDLITIGDAEIATVPGELFPEIGIGLPDDPEFYSVRPNRYFRHHNSADGTCDINDPVELAHCNHADPYIIPLPPVRKAMKRPVTFIFGLTNDELGYILPEADFYDFLDIGDHYEESNSLGPRTAGIVHSAIIDLIESE